MGLDDKLREIATDIFHDGVTQQDIDRIEQVFMDEGWVSPENAKKVQELVNSIANLANATAQLPTIQYVKVNKAVTKAQNLMSGREWYERFENELVKHDWGNHSCGAIALNAAKRAGGLDD